jgi:uncharacterized protein (TIGR00255 family)
MKLIIWPSRPDVSASACELKVRNSIIFAKNSFMLKSMTGYGRATAEILGTTFSAEIKTLNSKQFDLMLRIPSDFKEKEIEVRKLLSQRLERGKVDCTITIGGSEHIEKTFINKSLAVQYYTELIELQKTLELQDQSSMLSTLLKMPDVLMTKSETPDEEQWQQIYALIDQAIQNCNQSRQGEGEKLKSEFAQHIQSILDLLEQISPFEEERLQKIREKFRKELEASFENDNIDENRYEQEIIYYIEKIDITEEKVRLKSHCDYFLQTLGQGDSCGKKLAFIGQEIGREINTLGSKANHWNIQRIVVLMKDELEKIKEQLYNIL